VKKQQIPRFARDDIAKRDFIVTKNVSDGAAVSLRKPTRRKSDGKEEVGLLRSK
jgi:hypothetical protein